MPPLTVPLGDRAYDIHCAADTSSRLAALIRADLRAGRRAAWVSDANVAAAASDLFQGPLKGLPGLAIPPGERSKDVRTLGRIWEFLAAAGLDRASRLIAVGGGVVGDLAGFAAATYLRGIACAQVPTTLLAMVDSSVGGKTGINLRAGKNLAGAFHQPSAVFISTRLLATLPAREFRAGMAEVIKVGLLGDAPLFDSLERKPVTGHADRRLPGIIRTCCEAKARVVAADERETAPSGGRALLNLGHTFAHAIERVLGYGSLLHGEAVGIGLVAAAHLSVSVGSAPPPLAGRVAAVVAAHGLPTRLPPQTSPARLIAAMGRDKKARAGRLRFILLRSAGHAFTADDVPAGKVADAWATVL